LRKIARAAARLVRSEKCPEGPFIVAYSGAYPEAFLDVHLFFARCRRNRGPGALYRSPESSEVRRRMMESMILKSKGFCVFD
jgi:hypothetical protein